MFFFLVLKYIIFNTNEVTFSNFLFIYLFIFFRDVFMEKHWKSVIHKSICDYFFEVQGRVSFVMKCLYIYIYFFFSFC